MRKFFVALMLVLMLIACASADDGVIKVGIFNCLTGQNAFGGQLELEGTQLAHELFPEILGRKVELVIVDNKS
ncbi:MAG: branched-chain amino acid ABC transporter substrate-binding protein, partial [Synergistaceae bacterium]|nr:branched-chain amino acid ABC transporter substrate-binding protein [Synergistaceae bacterium]